jgi:hypothetical protein
MSTFLSSQPSSQKPHDDQAPAEDVLRDLIAVTDSSSNHDNDFSHGVKRRHEDEAGEEPLAKRDRLVEELELMLSSPPAQTAIRGFPGSSSASASTSAVDGPRAHGIQAARRSDPTVNRRSQDALAIRRLERRLPEMTNGTSRGPAKDGEDDTDSSLDNRET